MMSSNFTAWSLAEAVKRTTGSKNSDDKDSQFWTMLELGQLVAFGRRQSQSDREWIPETTCKFLINRDLKTSSASGLNAKDKPFLDILIYPVLHAPNAIDFLHGISLKDAFWRFVLHDPEVEFLGSKAIKANPDLDRVYREGWCHPNGSQEWPVAFVQGALAGGRSPNSPIGYSADPLPQEVQRAADVVCHRFSALLTPLRQGILEAAGDPVRSRGTDRILPSIWLHPSYFLDSKNGDVLQANDADTADWHNIRVKRWRAVMLKRPQQPNLFHVKPPTSDEAPLATIGHAFARSDHKLTPVRASINQAIKALWPNGDHMAVPVKTRVEMINDWQRANNFAVASGRTIDRHLKKKN
jgi:hypothetical protein